MDNPIAIRAAQIITPFENIKPGIVLIKGEKIAAVGPSTQIHIPDGAKLIDVGDKIVVPGFIDTHVHGRDGHRFGEDPESTTRLCRSIASTGTTSLLPTLGPGQETSISVEVLHYIADSSVDAQLVYVSGQEASQDSTPLDW